VADYIKHLKISSAEKNKGRRSALHVSLYY